MNFKIAWSKFNDRLAITTENSAYYYNIRRNRFEIWDSAYYIHSSDYAPIELTYLYKKIISKIEINWYENIISFTDSKHSNTQTHTKSRVRL